MNKLLTTLVCAGVIGLSGCAARDTINGIYESYPVQVKIPNEKSTMNGTRLDIYSKEKNGGQITFIDNNKDKRFDTIYLNSVSKGDSIERYANLEVGQKILEELKKQGEQK